MKPMRTPAIVECTATECIQKKRNVDPDCVYCPECQIKFVDLKGKVLSEIAVLAAIDAEPIDVSTFSKPDTKFEITED